MNRTVIVVGACLAVTGCTTTTVMVERLEPPAADVKGIREVAVLPFADKGAGEQKGELVSDRLAGILVSTGRYRVMKPDQMRGLLDKARLNYFYPPDSGLVRKMGTALGVDAVLYGECEKFQVQEETGLVKVTEPVWTGEYVHDSRGNIILEAPKNGEASPRKRYEKKPVEKNLLKRHADITVHFRMADAFLGTVIVAESESESGSWEGTGAAEIAKMPSRDVIFDLLLDRAIKKFVRQIAAHPVEEERVLEYGVFHSTRLGVELAKNNLWDEAMEKWMQATKAMPQDPAAYYDLGVGFERKGLFDLAYKAYENALTRSPHSDRYIKAVAKMQKLMKDLQ